jgi:GlpG protein
VPHQFENAAALWRGVPATLILVILSVCGFLLIYLNAPVDWLRQLTFSDFTVVDRRPVFVDDGSSPWPALFASGEYWRLITAIFLHFGWLHIVFNSLWLWELGALMEQRLGSIFLALFVIFTGIGSNYAQFYFGGPSLFGGMSGVVYALLGFCWIYHLIWPWGGFGVPRGIVIFMLVWLVFWMLPFSSSLLGVGIANAAHLGGLVLGCLVAAPLALLHRKRRSPMDYQQLLTQLSPELVATFKRSLELGRWPDGSPMSEEQREHTLRAVIAYESMHLPEEERVGYIDRSKKPADSGEKPLRWDEDRHED